MCCWRNISGERRQEGSVKTDVTAGIPLVYLNGCGLDERQPGRKGQRRCKGIEREG